MQEHLIASGKTEFGLNQVQTFHYKKASVTVRKLLMCSRQLGFRIRPTRQARQWVSYEQGLKRRRGARCALLEGAHAGDRAGNEIADLLPLLQDFTPSDRQALAQPDL